MDDAELDDLLGDLDLVASAQDEESYLPDETFIESCDILPEAQPDDGSLGGPSARRVLGVEAEVEQLRKELFDIGSDGTFFNPLESSLHVNGSVAHTSQPPGFGGQKTVAPKVMAKQVVSDNPIAFRRKVVAKKHALNDANDADKSRRMLPKFIPKVADMERSTKQMKEAIGVATAVKEMKNMHVGSKPLQPYSHTNGSFKSFKSTSDIQGECLRIISSSGETVYVPYRDCNNLKGLGKDHTGARFLSTPIQILTDELEEEHCRMKQDQSSREAPSMLFEPSQRIAKKGQQPWAQMYAPKEYCDLLSDDRTNREIVKWLKSWDGLVFGQKQKPLGQGINTNQQLHPEQKIALLSGPPGAGKTSLARVIARHCGYRPLFINASDDRTKSVLEDKIKDATGMKGMFGQKKPNCLIMDEVDGMMASEGQGAVDVIIKLIEQGYQASEVKKKEKKRAKSKPLCRPIICICNDLYAPVLRPLREVARTFVFKSPKPDRLVARLEAICGKEKVVVDRLALQILANKSECDIRASLNTLQFLASKDLPISSKEVDKAAVGCKDFRKSVFDIWDTLLFSRAGRYSSKFRNEHEQGMFETCTRLQDFGEHDLVSAGIFENFGTLQYVDPTIEKSFKAVNNLSNGALLTFTLPHYQPCYQITASQQVRSVQKAKLRWPSREMSARRKLLANRTLLERWTSKISPQAMSSCRGDYAHLEIVPALCKILVPNVIDARSEELNNHDEAHIMRLAIIMQQYGLRFDLNKRLQDGQQGLQGGSQGFSLNYRIHEIHEYNTRKNIFVPEASKRIINGAIESLRRNRLQSSAKRNPGNGSKPLDIGRSNSRMIESESRTGSDSSDVDMVVEGDDGDDGQVGTDRKRRSTWLDKIREAKRRKFMLKARSGPKPPLTFHYDEGKTDSVRRPTLMQEFL